MTKRPEINFNPYKGRWVAIVKDRVAGVGNRAAQAYRAAKTVRPKDRPQLYFVDRSGRSHQQPNDFRPWQKHAHLKKIAELLQTADQEAYLVGGAVRDGLLGKLNDQADLDLVVPADGLAVAKLLADKLGGAYYPVDPQRGVGRVVWPDRPQVDVAIYRGTSLEEDLYLRDFTINAIALSLDLANPRLIDPLAGQDDLQKGQIKALNREAFQDDPLRTVRAVRLAAQFGFVLTADTQSWITAYTTALAAVSAERLRDEIHKLLVGPRAGQGVAQLEALGLLAIILPQAEAMVGMAQSPPHHLSVFDHTLNVLDRVTWLDFELERLAFLDPVKKQLQDYFQTNLSGNLTRISLMPLAALLHDIGKPETFKQGSDGRIRFWQHPQVGADITDHWLSRLRFSGQARQFVVTIVRHHMRPLLLAYQKTVSRRSIHRFLEATGQAAPAIAIFSLLDHLGIYPPGQGQAEWDRLTEVVLRVCQTYFIPQPSPLLTGRDVISHLNLEPGPIVGQILARLKEAQAVGEIVSRQEALDFISTLNVDRG